MHVSQVTLPLEFSSTLKRTIDTVPHYVLQKLLFSYGIRGTVFNLLTCYLTGRTQYVIFNGIQSTALPINCGIPQGSILGPLFLLSL